MNDAAQSLGINRLRALDEFNDAMTEYGDALELASNAERAKDRARNKAEGAAAAAIRVGVQFDELQKHPQCYARGVVHSVVRRWANQLGDG